MYENFEINSKNKSIIINSIGKTDVIVKSDPQATVSSSVLSFLKIAIDLHKSGMQMYFCAEGHIHLDRFKDILKNTGRESVLSSESNRLSFEDVNTAFNDINWYHETLSNGFVYNEIMVSLITEHQIFERLRLFDKKSKSTSKGITLRELQELKHGDYVIHEDKGVARFEGFKNVNIGGNETECLRLVFDEDDVLYVNLNYIHKIQKYSASEGIIPKLSKLGTGDWLRKKERTKKKLKDIARDLIKLYAERKTQKGFAFSDDNIWQKEFEASFMYEDTIDQVKTTAEVKKDMESETPMDRLVCGDVGFGKTEIAIRAAFKAVQSGKQVAVLVPTTVLAQQHYMSFKDRISKYPVNVDVISRFRTSAQQHEILEKLSHGQIDILIGTHRILSKDINFKDLGLLVIDEEQRFGVGSKEKLRQIKVNIDTLTLTATPIPRTLNFSLMGARDLSIIETPPRNRLPVATEIIEFSMEVIAEAITKEVERGGQVFFVSDRIDDLNKIALDLKMTLPTINFAIAHGQMNPKELEKIMEDFVIQKTDVLITTKIVESGLDIPNANTMIINRAQNFGLAELYQLRGRVGRSNSQAYCFLLVPPNQKLSTTSIKRLQAIEEFTDLGSGFQLAMRDLEIRGAGNLLGGEQSGMIHDIGFELYQKILEEAVHELKVNEFSNIFDEVDTAKSTLIKNDDIAIEIGSDAFLPSSYIKSESERFSLYKRLYAVRDRKELDKLIEELVDRYGKLPIQAEELMFVVKLRMAAVATGFERLIVKQKTLLCELPNQNKQEFYAYAYPLLIDIIHDMNNCKISQMSNKIFLEIPLRSREDAISSIWKIKKSMETLDWE
jgi:transcription-repair coupling factor (superfamily II helicase)